MTIAQLADSLHCQCLRHTVREYQLVVKHHKHVTNVKAYLSGGLARDCAMAPRVWHSLTWLKSKQHQLQVHGKQAGRKPKQQRMVFVQKNKDKDHHRGCTACLVTASKLSASSIDLGTVCQTAGSSLKKCCCTYALASGRLASSRG